jgi:hypothetical protein
MDECFDKMHFYTTLAFPDFIKHLHPAPAIG